MSTNRKQRKESAFLRNFTTDIVNRMILCDEESMNKNSILNAEPLREKLRYITEETNNIIQQLNFVVPRNIPYLSLTVAKELTNNTRLYMRSSVNNYILQLDDGLTNFVDITHLLDYYICAGDRSIDKSDIEGVNAEISADSMFGEIVINDIFLDIAYFNSYSFLRNMTTAGKKNFNKIKAKFFCDNNLDSFFNKEKDQEVDYYSFAFSCHIEKENEITFDINRYIQLWDEFISDYYPSYTHNERSIKEQIEMRVDDHLPKDFYTKFDGFEAGIYYILRINKTSIPHKKSDYVCNLFGIKSISVGELKILSAEELIKSYENHPELFNDLFIAVFKVVIQ